MSNKNIEYFNNFINNLTLKEKEENYALIINIKEQIDYSFRIIKK